MDNSIQTKSKIIVAKYVARPSVYSHPDEWTYLHNQADWAYNFCYYVLSELKTDKEAATTKWKDELSKTDATQLKINLINACLAEDFQVVPQKSSLTPKQEDEYRALAAMDAMSEKVRYM